MKSATKTKPAQKNIVGKVVGRAYGLVSRALADETAATNLLVRQHAEVKALFKALQAAPSRAAKTAVFEELAQKLVAHDAIERELFYPACEKALGMTDLLGEALVEHGVIEFCIYEADNARKDADFAFKCTVLSEMVLHHVNEEEHSFFPEVEQAMTLAELERLGTRMLARFEAAKTEDFREAVYANLKQVLAGALKPRKGSGKASKKSLTPARVKAGKRRRAA